MKTTLSFALLNLCMLLYINTLAQSTKALSIDSVTKKVTITEIVKVDSSINSDELYRIIKEWFASDVGKFQRSSSEKASALTDGLIGSTKKDLATLDLSFKNDNPLKMDDPKDRKLIGRVICKYFGTSMGCIRLIYATFDIKVQIKENRYKCDFSNFNYSHFNHYTSKKMPIFIAVDSGPCKSSGAIEELMDCQYCSDGLEKFYAYIHNEVKSLTSDLKAFIESNKSESNW